MITTKIVSKAELVNMKKNKGSASGTDKHKQ